MGCVEVNWIGLAQSRILWQAIVLALLNLWIILVDHHHHPTPEMYDFYF